jgi:hypothetical protein
MSIGARMPIALQCYRPRETQTGIFGVMLLSNDHLQGKALAAPNREGEGATGSPRGSAPGKPLDPVQRLRHARVPVQGLAAGEARALLSGQFTRNGKSSSKFVRKEDLTTVRRELKNYELMKTLMDRWIDLATELSNLRLANKRP